mmetsp:Transcript_3537/g.8036  ORF Transcript_3537/g.8036 Transcript_3537/m.8036 type:complete len:208 (-) Transcript_3537:57-680(-)
MFSSCLTCSLRAATCCCAARRAARSLLQMSLARFSSCRTGTMVLSTSVLLLFTSAYISCTFTRFCLRVRLLWSASSSLFVNAPICVRRFSTSRSFSFILSSALLSTFTAAIMLSSWLKKLPLISTVSSTGVYSSPSEDEYTFSSIGLSDSKFGYGLGLVIGYAITASPILNAQSRSDFYRVAKRCSCGLPARQIAPDSVDLSSRCRE